MERALAYGFRWIAVAGVIGGVTGGIVGVLGPLGFGLWALSGVAVGAAQWAMVLQRLRVGQAAWIAATAIGSFITISVEIWLGLHILEERGFPPVTAAFVHKFFIDCIIMAVVGGLALGIPQALTLRDTPIHRWAWICATTLGASAAWAFSLWFIYLKARYLHLHGVVQMIPLIGGYWVALCLPQAILIECALKRTEAA